MGLTLLIINIFLCCLLESSLQITSKTKLTSTFSSKHSLKSADFNRISPLDPIDETELFNCIEDEDCSRLKYSTCVSNKCTCKKNFININNVCFERRFLGDRCLFSEECITYNSYCMNNICSCKPHYKNVANASCTLDFSEFCIDDCAWLENSYCDAVMLMGCICNENYILINEKCYKKGFLNDNCLYSDQCQVSNSLCLNNKCSCKPGYRVIGKSYCLYDKTAVSLGGKCEESDQCKTLNSYCHPYGYCECKTGYVRSGDYLVTCKSIYQMKKNYQTNTFITVICIASVVIAGTFIVVLIFAVKKRLFDIQSRRTQSSNVPELGITTPNSNCSTIQTTLEELDKPPSYEEVMSISQSSSNLMSNEVLPQSSCPSYSESTQ